MGQYWYEPFDVKEWIRRTFSSLNLGILILTLVFTASEFRFDWAERLVGTYLLSTNAQRPETGAIWEAGRQTSNAHEALNKIVARREDTHRSAHEARSFSHLAETLMPGEWVTLDKEQFKTLYLSLSSTIAQQVVDPALLVWLLNTNRTDRIFCEGMMGGIKVYFVDSKNQVIHHMDVNKETLLEMETTQAPVQGRLMEIEEFASRIYTTEEFFNAAFKLPPEMIPDLIKDPALLLKQEGILQRVGIWNEAQKGYIKLGFEFESRGQAMVLTVQAREWAVWQLSLILKQERQ